jgi:hypothetical protein
MSAPSRKAKRNPRRKAGRAARKPRPRKLAFVLTIEAQEMRVIFTPEYFAGQGHFEFHSPHNPPRRIPVSETGYRSHFAPMDEVRAAASPKDYARELVLAAISQPAKGAKTDARQLPLF